MISKREFRRIINPFSWQSRKFYFMKFDPLLRLKNLREELSEAERKYVSALLQDKDSNELTEWKMLIKALKRKITLYSEAVNHRALLN